jgi:RNA polymerase sigma-70 factor, ECF subfamily
MENTALLKSYNPVEDSVLQFENLVAEAKKGSRQAFNQLIDRFHQDIFRMVFYRTRSQMDAEDITQDVFLQAFKNIGQLKTLGHFKAWLYRIAINRIRDFYRKKKIRSLISFFSENDGPVEDGPEGYRQPDADPLDKAIQQDFWRQLSLSMDRLSKMEKEVFLLRFVEQLGIREIAEALSKSESTVKTHLYRALAKVKKDKTLKTFFDTGTI